MAEQFGNRLPGLLAAWLAVLFLLVGCAEEEPSTVGELASLADLRGRAVGVTSLGGPSTLEARYVLKATYGLDASPAGGDVALVEAPAESLPDLLRTGDIDAAVLAGLPAFTLLEEEDLYLLSHLTEEMRELTDAPVMTSVLLTYPDTAAQKRDALVELNRMLAESVTYFQSNRDSVLEAVASEQQVDRDFLAWWWDRHELALGGVSPEAQQQLLDVWEAAKTLGEIETYPELADVLFSQTEQDGTGAQGDRVTISLAVLDDPSRRAALYAIEQGIVRSDSVDVSVSYVPPSSLTDAVAARQFDVIEAEPLAVPLGAASDLQFVILSGGVQDLDGTLVFVRAERRSD